MRILTVLFVLLLGVGGCGNDDDETCSLTGQLCSCDLTMTSTNVCNDYSGQKKGSAESECSSAGGTFSASQLCKTSGRVGTCKVTVFSNITYKRYYSDAVTNQAACTISNFGTGFLGAVEWESD